MSSRHTALSIEDQELLDKFNNRINDSGKVAILSVPLSRKSDLSSDRKEQLPVFVGTQGSAARNINYLYGEINECIDKLQTNVSSAV